MSFDRGKDKCQQLKWNFHTEIWIHWEGRRREPWLWWQGFSITFSYCSKSFWLLESVISHISAAMCEDVVADVVVWFFDEEAGSEDHPVSRGQGELLRGQRLVTANQWALVELSSQRSSILLIGKGLEGDESLPPLCCSLSPFHGRQISWSRERRGAFLRWCRRYHLPGKPGDAALSGPLFHKELTVDGRQT